MSQQHCLMALRLTCERAQVQDDAVQSMTIKNTGKYAINYEFTIESERMRSLFVVEPAKGQIAAGASQPVKVIFNKERTLKKEVSIKSNANIKLSIVEPLTDTRESVIPITVRL